MSNSTVSNLYLVCSLLPIFQSWRKACVRTVFPRYFGWLNNYTALLVYILLRLSLLQEHYYFDGICKLLCAEENDKKPSWFNCVFPFPTLRLARKMVVPGSFDLPSESLAFKEHFRILSSNTKYFFLVSVRELRKTNLCNCYAHLSFILLKYFLNTFEVWLKIKQISHSTRFQRTGVCDELLLEEMLKEKLSCCLFQLLQADRAASQVQMLSKYCLRGS